MENYKRNKNYLLLLTIYLFLGLFSCDEKLVIPIEAIDENERLLTREWQYSYILMDGDTIRYLASNGEPTIGVEFYTPIGLRYLLYKDDHSYELRSVGPSFLSLGYEESYQPNYGFWDLDESGNPSVLIHNQTIAYEVRYELLQLDENTMIRKQVGDRITYMYLNLREETIDTLTVSSWIEVFVPLPERD
jgi:hypothetical protein